MPIANLHLLSCQIRLLFTHFWYTQVIETQISGEMGLITLEQRLGFGNIGPLVKPLPHHSSFSGWDGIGGDKCDQTRSHDFIDISVSNGLVENETKIRLENNQVN